ncbi:flagellar assembly protein FliH [Rheinheimera baltica]|uniref:flagellar assembly protein FliH n=1 Tax=Rheinheimera baltica TaxID=67576 RepID=UPI00273DDB80|nr:flagellar assembly protein FliH [Rheinheimera baltica]MDP5143168.1 flagellar assembly protein FliH [Rheinheimera baltica]
MTTDSFKYKRPFSPDDDTQDQLRHWQTPELTDERTLKTSRTNALNKTQPIAKTVRALEEDELVIKPLTADDIEQIRQAAYDEGVTEGKEDGFSKGYAEGREQGQQDGFNQGQAEGKKQGLVEGQDELNARLAQLTSLLDQLQKPLAKVNEQVQQQLVQLSLAMAQAVIGVEVKTNTDVVLKAISEATSALPLDATQMLIKLNPADINIVEQFYSKDTLNERGWQLREDPAIEQGGCVVQSSRSSVDRTLSQRLQGSLEHFLQLQQHEQPQPSDAKE